MTTRKRAMSRPVGGRVGPLPCPFCGSDNLRVGDHGIECRNCGVWMGDGTQCRTIGNTVLEAWNHRANNAVRGAAEPRTLDGLVGGKVGR